LNWRIAKVLEEFEQARRQLLKLRAKKLAKFGRFGGGQQKNKSSS
jgi:hypothetical protein